MSSESYLIYSLSKRFSSQWEMKLMIFRTTELHVFLEVWPFGDSSNFEFPGDTVNLFWSTPIRVPTVNVILLFPRPVMFMINSGITIQSL